MGMLHKATYGGLRAGGKTATDEVGWRNVLDLIEQVTGGTAAIPFDEQLAHVCDQKRPATPRSKDRQAAFASAHVGSNGPVLLKSTVPPAQVIEILVGRQPTAGLLGLREQSRDVCAITEDLGRRLGFDPQALGPPRPFSACPLDRFSQRSMRLHKARQRADFAPSSLEIAPATLLARVAPDEGNVAGKVRRSANCHRNTASAMRGVNGEIHSAHRRQETFPSSESPG
jgi:hypothetical protein